MPHVFGGSNPPIGSANSRAQSTDEDEYEEEEEDENESDEVEEQQVSEVEIASSTSNSRGQSVKREADELPSFDLSAPLPPPPSSAEGDDERLRSSISPETLFVRMNDANGIVYYDYAAVNVDFCAQNIQILYEFLFSASL